MKTIYEKLKHSIRISLYDLSPSMWQDIGIERLAIKVYTQYCGLEFSTYVKYAMTWLLWFKYTIYIIYIIYIHIL